MAALYRFATPASVAKTVAELISPENESVRLALIIYARANGIPLDEQDLDTLRDHFLNTENPDLGPVLASALTHFVNQNGKNRLSQVLSQLAAATSAEGDQNMLTYHIALVAERPFVPPEEMARVSAALQKQVTRDFASVWNVDATVDLFPSLPVPLGYWPIILTDRELGGLSGNHRDSNGQPLALVEMSDSWSLTASHECLEMLADPFGCRLVAGDSPASGDKVEFIVEVCDPCEDARYAYTVNGVLVSDFVTPHYFDPVAAPGVRYSLTGAVRGPRHVLEGGYLSWRDPMTNLWYQRQTHGGQSVDVNLGQIELGDKSIREIINLRTPNHLAATRLSGGKIVEAVRRKSQLAAQASEARAREIENDIERIVREQPFGVDGSA